MLTKCMLSILFIGLSLFSFRFFEVGDNPEYIPVWGGLFLVGNLAFYFFYLFKKTKSYKVSLFYFSVLAVSLFGVSHNTVFFLGYSYDVSDSESNVPVINIGDITISKHFNYQIEINDFIGFKSPEGNLLRKKVVGLPKDTVYVCSGKVFRLGEQPSSCVPEQKVYLCDTCYFTVGINSGNSYDSRHFGAISKVDIVAKSLYKIDVNEKITMLTN